MKVNRIIKEDFDRLCEEYKDKFKKLENRSILITGANGMLTTYLSEFLSSLADDNELQLYLQCRNLEKAKRVFCNYLDRDYFHLLSFDLENDAVPDIRFDYILHAASPAGTKAFKEAPVDVINPNVIGTWNLLQHARRKGAEKVLLFSSSSIYGEIGSDKKILTENDYGIVDPLGYRSCYIESKRLSEQMGMAFWRQYQVPVSFIRICHTYGPTFDLQRDSRIIPRLVRHILRGEDIEIYQDPDSVIQYTYIADMVAAVLLVLLEGRNGEAYNAGGDEVVTMEECVTWMIGADPSIQSSLVEKKIDANYSFGERKGISFLKLSNHKLTELGWRQLYSNKEGFSRLVKSYLEDAAAQNAGGGILP